MFIFTIGDRVLGVCDYDHLKENVEKIWHESCEDGTEKDVIIHEVNEMNKVVYESPYATYYFDKYDGNYAVVNYSLYDENAKGIALGYDSSNSLISILQTNEAITGGGYILCGLGNFGNYNGNSSGSRLVRHQSNIGREFGVPQGENWN